MRKVPRLDIETLRISSGKKREMYRCKQSTSAAFTSLIAESESVAIQITLPKESGSVIGCVILPYDGFLLTPGNQ